MPTIDSTGKPAGYGNNSTEYGPIGFRPRPLDGSYITPRQPMAPTPAPSAAPSMAMNAVLEKFGGSMEAYNRWWHGIQGDKPRGWDDALAKLGEAPNSIQSPVSDSPGGPMGALQVEDFPTPNPVTAVYINSPEGAEAMPEPRPLGEAGLGGMTMPSGASGYGTMSSSEGMPQQQQMRAARDWSGMDSPQMGAGMGPSVPQPQMYSPMPGAGMGPLNYQQPMPPGLGIGPRRPMEPMPHGMPAGGGNPYVAGQPFTQGMFPGAPTPEMGGGAGMPPGEGLVMPPGMGTGFDGTWPQIPPDVPYVAGQQFNPGMFPGGPGFGPMDALQQKAIERSKRTQAFSNAARKLSR